MKEDDDFWKIGILNKNNQKKIFKNKIIKNKIIKN